MLMEIVVRSSAEAMAGVLGTGAGSSHVCTVQSGSGAGVTVLG
jgi:hypothetical protein